MRFTISNTIPNKIVVDPAVNYLLKTRFKAKEEILLHDINMYGEKYFVFAMHVCANLLCEFLNFLRYTNYTDRKTSARKYFFMLFYEQNVFPLNVVGFVVIETTELETRPTSNGTVKYAIRKYRIFVERE